MPTSSPPWPDLPLDLLLGIADRLHVPTDYVRFHAVCKPWRDAIPPAHCRPAFLPWLVAPRDAAGHCKVRCVFSSKSSSPHRTAGSEVRVLDRRWVISTDDGTATCWLLTPSTAAQSACAAVDPLTWSAAAMPVPRFPDVVKRWEESAVGLCYGDGTTVLYAYGLIHGWYLIANGFDVAIRQPGDDAEWRLVRRNSIHVHDDDRRRCCLAYHDGKIVLCVEDKRLIEPATPADASIDNHAWRSRPSELGKVSLSSHLVESRGELLWAFVQLDRCYYIDRRGDVGTINDLASSPSVSVYALAEKEEGGEEVEWVKRDGWSMADRVMFLGRPAGSFAVDAARFGMSDGRGCAYFVDRGEVYGGLWSKSLVTRSRVFKYSFLEDTTELLEQLPEEWTDVGCTWITPQISIAPTEEIRDRAHPTHETAAETQPQVGTSFRIHVSNLPRKVDSHQLRDFFSKHGKVDDAQVMRERRTGRSRGFGFVTMVTPFGEQPVNAIAKLNRQCLDGRPLRVKFADQ